MYLLPDRTSIIEKGKMMEPDPLIVNSFAKLVDYLRFKVRPQMREMAFKSMLRCEEYTQKGNVYYMKGAEYNKTEEHIASKLEKAGYLIVFPNKGQINQIKELENDNTLQKNDVYLYDKKTYYQQKADLKAVSKGSVDAIKNHITKGSKQAPVIVIDIPAIALRWNVIRGIKDGWTKDTKTILLNWRGQWYEIDKDKVFSHKKIYRNWLEDHIQ